jgi:hypothetical protein
LARDHHADRRILVMLVVEELIVRLYRALGDKGERPPEADPT